MDKALSQNDAELSPVDEYFLGRAVGANLLSRYKIYARNAPLTDYLNSICFALAVNSSQPDLYAGYHVLILDSPEINAFATPGGHIFITRALIQAVESEDALAAVIAHEMAHIHLKHGIAAVNNIKLTRESFPRPRTGRQGQPRRIFLFKTGGCFLTIRYGNL
jgi:predicted Zn-dependent protease